MQHPQSPDARDEAPPDASTAQTGSLRGRVALLTGAGGDLGSAIAGALAIRAEGLLAGGIGVSGVSPHEDAELALGALARAGFDFDFGGGQIDREEGEDG